jgi:hypothetical protein
MVSPRRTGVAFPLGGYGLKSHFVSWYTEHNCTQKNMGRLLFSFFVFQKSFSDTVQSPPCTPHTNRILKTCTQRVAFYGKEKCGFTVRLYGLKYGFGSFPFFMHGERSALMNSPHDVFGFRWNPTHPYTGLPSFFLPLFPQPPYPIHTSSS